MDDTSLMDLALNELNKRIDRIEKRGWKSTYKFAFQHKDIWDDKKIIDYTVEVKFENRGWGKPMGYLKQKHRNHFIVFINTCITCKESLKNTYVHEITHISQKFNKFLVYSNEHEIKRYERDVINKKRKSKISINKYYNSRHHQNLAEHEANLSTLLQLLKESKIDSATKFILNHSDYFHFEHKAFIQKAYAYGVSKDNILKIKETVKNYFNNHISECEDRNSYIVWNNLFHDFKRNPLMNMFEIRKIMWMALYDIGNKISKPEFRMEKNLEYAKKQISLL